MAAKYASPAWWNRRIVQAGATAESADYTGASHGRRLDAIATALRRIGPLDSLAVIDAPCGAGLLDKRHGPFRAYTGGDFSGDALVEAAKGCRTPDPVLCLWDARDGLPPASQHDVIVMCGLFCFEYLFTGAEDAVAYAVAALHWAPFVVANFPWSGSGHGSGIRSYAIDDVIRDVRLHHRAVDVSYGYEPHEFLATIRRA